MDDKMPIAASLPVNSIRRYFVLNSIGVFGLSMLSRLLGFISNIFLVRLLGIEQYGAYIFVMSWFGVLAIISMLGLKSVIVRDVAKYIEKKDWSLIHGIIFWCTRTSITFSLLVAIFSGLIFFLLHGTLDGAIYPSILISLFLLPLNTAITVFSSVLHGMKRVALSNFPSIFINAPIFLCLLLIFGYVLHVELQAASVILFMGISLIAALASGIIILSRILPNEVKVAKPQYDATSWRKSGITLVLAEAISEVNTRIPLILISILIAVEGVAIFNIAQLMTSIAGLLLIASNSVLNPLISSMYSTGDIDRLQRMITRTTRVMTVATGILAVALLIAQPLVLQLFGDGLEPANPVLPILLLAQVLNTAVGPVGQLLLMTGYERDVTLTMIPSTIFLTVMLLILIPPLHEAGAAAAVLLSTIFWNGVLAIIAARRLHLDCTFLGLNLYPQTMQPTFDNQSH